MAIARLDASFLRDHPLPVHDGAGDKEARGRVLVAGGSTRLPGAVLLAATAAMRAGAGKLTVATASAVAIQLGLLLPEAMVIPLPQDADGEVAAEAGPDLAALASHSGALVLGPGLAAHAAEATLRHLAPMKLVLDAGGIDALGPDCMPPAGQTVLTPHTGEMARLLDLPRDAVGADKLAHARDAARRYQSVVVMKGDVTEIVTPQGEAWRYERGTIGLATSGSGDVLAGLVGGLLARGAPPLLAALWAVYLHGEAGSHLARHHGSVGLLARELPDAVPGLMARV